MRSHPWPMPTPSLVWAALALTTLATSSSPWAAAPTSGEPPPSVRLMGAGATFPAVLYKQWFASYQTDHPGTTISYEPVGSGEGLRRFNGRGVKGHERVDFGASERPEPDPEDRSRGALTIPMTAGGVVLAYNLPGFEGELRLSRQAYAGIFLGEVRSWKDPLIARANPGAKLPKLTIAPIVRQDASGTTFVFTSHLSAVSETWERRHGAGTLVSWPGSAMRAPGNEGVAGRIKHAEGSIGYVGYEYARKLGLKMVTLENRDGHWVRPTARAFTAGLAAAPLSEDLRAQVADPRGPDVYPIVTFSWMLLYKSYPDPQKAAALRDLFRWCLTTGQRAAPDLGYVELPPNVVARALSALEGVAPAG
jgi:phosphate transport system substrate-binding protein